MSVAVARKLLGLFNPRDPVVPALLTADLGLRNNTQWVSVLIQGAEVTAIYLPSLAVQVPGNCFVARGSAGALAIAFVVATNYQVPIRYGWGSGEVPYTPPDFGPDGVVILAEVGWGDQEWGQ